MNKKISGIFLTIIILAMMIALQGCGSSNKNNSSEEEQTQIVEEESQEEETSNDVEDEEDTNILKAFSKENNNSWNLNQGGLIARDGEWYYYTEQTYGLLYKVKLDGTERKKVDSVQNVQNINVSDGWIFYTGNQYGIHTNNIREKATLHKIRTNGTGRVNSNIRTDNVHLNGEWLYFSNKDDEGRLYKIDLNFKNLTRLSSDRNIKNIFFYNDWLYYLTSEGIFKIREDGTERQSEISLSHIAKFGISNGYIYYLTSNSNDVYRANLINTAQRNIILNRIHSFTVRDNWIFYARANSTNLLKADLDEFNETIIDRDFRTNTWWSVFTVLGEHIFFSNRGLSLNISEKRALDERYRNPIANSNVENKIGLDFIKILEYVDPRIRVEDRNAIMKSIYDNMLNYMEGNSAIVEYWIEDVNNNNLDEIILIYKQHVTDSTTTDRAVNMSPGNQQVILTVIKWVGDEIITTGSNYLRSGDRIASGGELEFNMSLQNLFEGTGREIVFVSRYTFSEIIDVYRLHERSLEWVEGRDIPGLVK